MTDTPIDRTADAYREHIRELAQSERKPRPDRKRQHRDRAAPPRVALGRAAPDRARYPWPTDLDVFDPD